MSEPAVIPIERRGRRMCWSCGCQWLLYLFDANPVEDECAKDQCPCHDAGYCAAFERALEESA